MLDCKATLRVKSETLVLKELVNVLGEPTQGFSKGQEFGKAKKIRPHTQWSLVSEINNSDMQACILKILDFYNEIDLNSIKRACDIDILCMVSSDNGQGSFVLEARIYQKLLDAGLNITFDFYSD